MDICEVIEVRRPAWAVYSGLRYQSYESPEALANEFGLKADPGIYFEVAEHAARAILRLLLHREMAHRSELMSLSDAEALANSFIMLFHDQDVHYFSNGNWHMPQQHVESRVVAFPEWTPATEATFDGGIIALGDDLFGCVWFEDED